MKSIPLTAIHCFFIRYKFLIFLVFAIGFSSACKKNNNNVPSETEPPAPEPVEQNFYKDLKIDSLQQLSFVVSYQLTKGGKATGLVTALDSLALLTSLADYMEREVVYREDRYYTTIEWPSNLFPMNDVVWFRIYVVDEAGEKTYSQVFSQKIATYMVKNKHVVNGKGAYNKHPKDFFINYEGSAIGTYDNSLIVNAVTDDVNIKNYRATLNERPISITRIDPVLYSANHKSILFDVPDDFPLGPVPFKFYYRNQLVYTEKLTVINGGLITKDQHVVPLARWRSIFVHNNELYTLTIGSGHKENQFYKWNPENKQWTALPNLDLNARIGNIEKAHSIGGIVYLSLSSRSYVAVDAYHYNEVIATFEPSKGTWRDIEVMSTTNPGLSIITDVVESFAIENNIYYIVRETSRITNITRTIIKEFNVNDNSFKELMELENKFYKATVLEGRVYLLCSDYGVQEYATSTFISEFSLLDIAKKSLTGLSWISHKNAGVYKPYLTSFKGKIYLYGGHAFSGYTSLYSSIFAVYDPALDKWNPVSGYSYFTAWVSQTDGFLYPMGGKLYLGLGYDRYTNGHIDGSKVNYSIYQVSIR